MRYIRLILVVLLMFLPMFVLANPTTQVTMTAYLDQSTYQIGQPIVLEADLHNTGDQMVSIGGGAFEDSSFVLTIENASGQIIPRTALGQRILTRPSAVYWNPVVAIRPQGTLRVHINLSAIFEVSRAGSYIVRVSRTFELFPSQEFTLTDSPLKFRVVGATRNSPGMPFVHDPNADLNIP